MSSEKILYKTKPLENWAWGKELRNKHYSSIMTAKNDGKTLTSGSAHARILAAGLPNYVHLCGEPFGATIATMPELAQECAEAAEAQGFSRDMCAYMRLYWGASFLDKSPWGKFPKPDLGVQSAICDSHAKWHQMMTEYMGIPFFVVEVPQYYPALVDPHPSMIDYTAEQFMDMTSWMEKVTGQKWDDEKFITALLRINRIHVLWAEICTLNRAVPAPLDLKSMYSLYWPAAGGDIDEDTEAFYRALKDEVEQRVDEGIAALATERCRLMHENQPPWYALYIFRYMEGFGAVTNCGGYVFALGGAFDLEDDEQGNPHLVTETPVEQLEPRPKNREESMYLMAKLHFGRYRFVTSPDAKRRTAVALADDWKCNGAIIMLNRGCEGLSVGQTEARLALIDTGVPTMVYEANMADKREWDDREVRDRLDSYMESLGLTRLED